MAVFVAYVQSPAVIRGWLLLPSSMGRSSFLGVRARMAFADPKGTAQGVGLLISSSENIPSKHSGE
jgi:hypothetical protein